MARVKGLKRFLYGATRNAIQGIGFLGRVGAGAITVAGVAVGDQIWSVANTTDGTQASTSFEITVTVAGQIQQTDAADLSTKRMLALVKKA